MGYTKPNDCYFCHKAYGSIHQGDRIWTCPNCDKAYDKLLKRGRDVLKEMRKFCAKHDIHIDNNRLTFKRGDVSVSFFLDPANDQAPPKEVAMVTPTVLMPLPDTPEGGEPIATTS